MTPLGNAVCFVDGDGVNVIPIEKSHEVLIGKPFGRNEQHSHLAASKLLSRFPLLCRIKRTVDANGVHADLLERIDLVLHQRDEGRDNDGHPATKNGRCLVAKGFATSGRHNHQRVAALKNGRDRSVLRWSKAIKPPYFSKDGKKPIRNDGA